MQCGCHERLVKKKRLQMFMGGFQKVQSVQIQNENIIHPYNEI
jgi:hypothetical protein